MPAHEDPERPVGETPHPGMLNVKTGFSQKPSGPKPVRPTRDGGHNPLADRHGRIFYNIGLLPPYEAHATRLPQAIQDLCVACPKFTDY